MAEEMTTISLSKDTRNWLADRGGKDDSFDKIIRRLLLDTERYPMPPEEGE